MNVPEINTARLHLRPLRGEDVDAIYGLWITDGVRKYLWDDDVISKEKAASVVQASISSFETSGLGLWVVCARGEDDLIGFCGFWFFHDPPQLQLLYGIDPARWGKGLATEAAKAMIRYGFEELSFERIEASTDAPNVGSVRVMEKAGMRFWKRGNSSGLDTVYYEITSGNSQPDATPYALEK